MFYSETLLTDKHSPIGIAWLLATLGPKNQARKISRKELIAFDLVQACGYISEPPEPLALRTSATLLYGVAKVYNQHFEEFFANVNTFHHTLRRTIITDFSTTVNGGTGGTRGIDLTDEGKSKIDQITFAGIDLGWQSGLDLHFGLIDWSNPLGPGRKRRASSKLDSQGSQQSKDGGEDEEEDEEEGSEDEEGVARKRRRIDSSPGLNDHLRKSSTIHHHSDRISAADDFQKPVDLDLDFDFMDQPDTSFSAPGGEPIETGETSFNAEDQHILPGGTPQREVREASLDSQGNAKPVEGLKSAIKRRTRDSLDSEEAVEEALAVPKKKVKQPKKVKWDQSLELVDEDERGARGRYRATMEAQRRELLAKEQEKTVQSRADAMVDSAGGWLDFFDPEMKAMFATITKTGQWKWELDVAGQRNPKQIGADGQAYAGADERGGAQIMPMNDDDPFLDNQQTGADATFFESGPYVERQWDFDVELQDANSKPRRSQSTDVELARRASQGSQAQLPWVNRNVRSEDDDFYDPADAGFSPGSLHFSVMTPQEARLRKSSRSKSGLTGSQQPGGIIRRDGRSRSASILQDKALRPAEMLFNGDDADESVPQDVMDLAEQPSQYRDLPDVFRPEHLATLENQCRGFMSFVEGKMKTLSVDEVEFDDVVHFEQPKNTAATAFYNCLTLATKNILKLDQAEAFDGFTIRFAA